jgi:hypothetical protein
LYVPINDANSDFFLTYSWQRCLTGRHAKYQMYVKLWFIYLSLRIKILWSTLFSVFASARVNYLKLPHLEIGLTQGTCSREGIGELQMRLLVFCALCMHMKIEFISSLNVTSVGAFGTTCRSHEILVMTFRLSWILLERPLPSHFLWRWLLWHVGIYGWFAMLKFSEMKHPLLQSGDVTLFMTFVFSSIGSKIGFWIVSLGGSAHSLSAVYR